MFAETNVFEPNVLYLTEKPPKIVKGHAKPPKKKRKRAVSQKKCAITAAKLKKSKKSEPCLAKVKAELEKEGCNEPSGDDPLFTPLVEIKMDCDAESAELLLDTNPVVNYYKNDDTIDTDEEKYDFSSNDDRNYNANLERELAEDEEQTDSDEGTYGNDDTEDEPLIMIVKRKGRPRIHHEKKCAKVKAPSMIVCREKCKQLCTQKFSEHQRLRACDYFWSLSREDRVQYIRKHIRSRRSLYIRRKKTANRGSNYYLDGSEGTEMIRVCRKYFEATLCVTDHMIKKALDDYTPEPELESKVLSEQRREEVVCNNTKDVQQILDPETGNLVTIDPNAKKDKKTAPKKKHIRRKPGDPMPEHFPKPIKCEQRCIFKCHIQFTEDERKQICDMFWSLDYKRKKDFVLGRMETKEVERQITAEFRKPNRPPRAFHTRFYLRSGINGENKRNALEFADKNTGVYTGKDRRGHNMPHNKTNPETRQIILDHISSYPTWMPNKKSRKRYLHHKLSIHQMYMDYKNMSLDQQREFVSPKVYYKSFHENNRLAFLCNPQPKRGGGFLLSNPNISHYTGNEPGGYWTDASGQKLDVSNSMIDLTQNCMRLPRFKGHNEPQPFASTTVETVTTAAEDSMCATTTTLVSATSTPASSSFSLNQPLGYAHFMDPSTLAMLNSGNICQPPSAVVRHEFNPTLYDGSLVQAHTSTSSSAVFRRL